MCDTCLSYWNFGAEGFDVSQPRSFPLDLASKDTPTSRPLAEPQLFNYDNFVRKFVPSRKRFQILFRERRIWGQCRPSWTNIF